MLEADEHVGKGVGEREEGHTWYIMPRLVNHEGLDHIREKHSIKSHADRLAIQIIASQERKRKKIDI